MNEIFHFHANNNCVINLQQQQQQQYRKKKSFNNNQLIRILHVINVRNNEIR